MSHHVLAAMDIAYTTLYRQLMVTIRSILPPFQRRILRILCSEQPLFHISLIFHLEFGAVSLRVNRHVRGSKERKRYANYPCNYFRSDPTVQAGLPGYLNDNLPQH